MELIGRIITVLPERSGISARSGSEWHLASYVLETTTDRFPRKMLFEVFGADKIQQFNIQAGEMVRVSFDIDAREYTRKDGTTAWVNSIRAWNVDRNLEASQPAGAPVPDLTPFDAPAPDAAPASAPQPAPMPTQAPAAEDTVSDLPF